MKLAEYLGKKSENILKTK